MADKCKISPNKPPRHYWVISTGHGGGIALTCAWCRKRTTYRRTMPLGNDRKEYEGRERSTVNEGTA